MKELSLENQRKANLILKELRELYRVHDPIGRAYKNSLYREYLALHGMSNSAHTIIQTNFPWMSKDKKFWREVRARRRI